MKNSPATTARIKAAGRKEKRKREKRRANNGRWPARDEKYKEWIRTLPCVVCWLRVGYSAKEWLEEVRTLPPSTRIWRNFSLELTECAHVGERGLGQTASDRETIPLCRVHHGHGYPESAHTLQKGFAAHHGIDISELVQALNAAYESRGTE